jgi:hypothetical protein
LSNAIFFRNLGWNKDSIGVIVIAVLARVRVRAARVASKSLLQDLHDLEVGYIVFIVNACARA